MFFGIFSKRWQIGKSEAKRGNNQIHCRTQFRPQGISEHRERNDMNIRQHFLQYGRGLQTVHLRHGEIQQNQISLEFARLLDRFSAVPRELN